MSKTFNVDRQQCNDLAYRIFMRVSGINKEGRKFQRMQKDASRIRKAVEDRVKIRAAYAYYEEVSLKGQTASVGGETLSCKAFEQIRGDAVEGAYVYALSAGDFGFPEDPIMDQLYADIWGTAFTDAVRLLLKKELEKASKLSDSFGPGFYGMDVSDMKKLASLLSFGELEIELRNSRIIVPLKSCAGFYFKVNDNYRYLRQECENCRGSYTSCKLCQFSKREEVNV